MTVDEGVRSQGGRTAGQGGRAAVRELLAPLLEAGPLDVVDVGGGTGHLAVPLAALGHRVTVVDPSPDALATLERRAAEAGVRVRALQGEAAGLQDVVGARSADLVLCHSVLQYVEDLGAAVGALVAALRPGGGLSLLVPGALAAVVQRAVAGHFEEARELLAAAPAGGDGPRRFTPESLLELAAGAGLAEPEVHGVRIFADLVPGGHAEADPHAAESLRALEAAAAVHPVLRSLAARLHLFARRPA
ncbi:class I SAM-dependent methyltransferase [Actinocorallia populi]|uniref:class I SAM-dependent methyltransferase n=1 Tax=Actinocorallia populi TaxID=2079200 RepID=UPI000D086AB7|nr:methyltransferase domain-containing protein [Actinocorallia populi]